MKVAGHLAKDGLIDEKQLRAMASTIEREVETLTLIPNT